MSRKPLSPASHRRRWRPKVPAKLHKRDSAINEREARREVARALGEWLRQR